MYLRNSSIKIFPRINNRSLFTNFTNEVKHNPSKEDIFEFTYNSIKLITFCSIIWGFESQRKYQLHHLEVHDRILSNYTECIKRQNTKERCLREKRFLDYIFNPEY